MITSITKGHQLCVPATLKKDKKANDKS